MIDTWVPERVLFFLVGLALGMCIVYLSDRL